LSRIGHYEQAIRDVDVQRACVGERRSQWV